MIIFLPFSLVCVCVWISLTHYFVSWKEKKQSIISQCLCIQDCACSNSLALKARRSDYQASLIHRLLIEHMFLIVQSTFMRENAKHSNEKSESSSPTVKRNPHPHQHHGWLERDCEGVCVNDHAKPFGAFACLAISFHAAIVKWLKG